MLTFQSFNKLLRAYEWQDTERHGRTKVVPYVCSILDSSGGVCYIARRLRHLNRDYGRVKSGNFGHQVNSDSDLVCFIS